MGINKCIPNVTGIIIRWRHVGEVLPVGSVVRKIIQRRDVIKKIHAESEGIKATPLGDFIMMRGTTTGNPKDEKEVSI